MKINGNDSIQYLEIRDGLIISKTTMPIRLEIASRIVAGPIGHMLFEKALKKESNAESRKMLKTAFELSIETADMLIETHNASVKEEE